MQKYIGERQASFFLVLLAVLLSAFNGFLNLMSEMVFSGHESTRMWASIYVPAILWLPALGCFKFARSGVVIYAVVCAAAVLLCVDPFREGPVYWAQCIDNVRFSLYGGVLLLINAGLPKEWV
jgi:hypothetical protein